jgi:hypothetical protein
VGKKEALKVYGMKFGMKMFDSTKHELTELKESVNLQ